MIRTVLLALGALALVFWVGLAYWVNKDARLRIRATGLVGVATALGLVPFLGPAIYLLFRPAETRGQIRARKAERSALESLIRRSRPVCPECSAPADAGYLVCPVCATHLRGECTHCEGLLEPFWQMCPYCAAPVEAEPDLDEALTREALATPALDPVPGPEARV